MLHYPDLTQMSLPALDLVIRAVVVYLAILLLLRVGGKRQLGQMGATEFVALLLISNAVQNSMNGGDNSLTGGLLLAVVLIFMSWLISVATFKSRKISMIFEGTPTLLVHKGKMIPKHMAKERLTPQDLSTLLRKQNVHHLSEIRNAILEADGTLTVTKCREKEDGEAEEAGEAADHRE
jgi:uncharacterized membrane protein YcaP (DUF421 family)